MISLAHIVNLAAVDPNSDLGRAQPITVETMRQARNWSAGETNVELCAACFPEDAQLVPAGFRRVRDLDRSVLDLATFALPRRLPVLADILGRLHGESEAEFLIYTNADIGVLPSFYQTIDAFAHEGYDAIVINRRTLPAELQTLDDLPRSYAAVGEAHIGHDCFAFRRELFPRFVLGEAAIGVRLVGRVLLWNLAAFGTRFAEFTDLHLTFHHGSDRSWQQARYADYDAFNARQARRVLDALGGTPGALERVQARLPGYLAGILPRG